MRSSFRHMNSRARAAAFVSLLLFTSQVGLFEKEISYDDSSPETTSSLDIGYCLAVRFSLPAASKSTRLVRVMVYRAGRSAIPMRVHVLRDDGITELTTPFNFTLTAESAWSAIDVRPAGIIVPEEFYIAIEYLAFYDPLIGRDATNPRGRSYYGKPGAWTPVLNGENVMIRAVVKLQSDPTPGNIGELFSARNLALAAPYVFVSCMVVLVFLIVSAKSAQCGK